MTQGISQVNNVTILNTGDFGLRLTSGNRLLQEHSLGGVAGSRAPAGSGLLLHDSQVAGHSWGNSARSRLKDPLCFQAGSPKCGFLASISVPGGPGTGVVEVTHSVRVTQGVFPPPPPRHSSLGVSQGRLAPHCALCCVGVRGGC